MQKIWNKVRQLQDITGFTGYSPIWDNKYYKELQSLTCAARWKSCCITHLVHIFSSGKLCSFLDLQAKFGLPQSMYSPYLQLSHAIKAQTVKALWIQSPAPVFHYMSEVSHFKGFISRSYSMLLTIFLNSFPARVTTRWESDVGMRRTNAKSFCRLFNCALSAQPNVYLSCILCCGYISLLRGCIGWA